MRRLLCALNPLTMMFVYGVVAPVLNFFDKPAEKKRYCYQVTPSRPIDLKKLQYS
ncbi:MAG: hypothetical protein H0Z40_11140 [Desulfotomaculum sp.]|nr:hypothetical protein [Desulfotomaculum sp.]